MDSRIKINQSSKKPLLEEWVSILVLMDSRIKIKTGRCRVDSCHGFNPCFNG